MSDESTPAVPEPAAPHPLLARALDQSEQVKTKVEECVVELASVNDVLQQDVVAGLPLKAVEEVLQRSELVEEKVQECVDDLAHVNDALAEEIDQRRTLERQLEHSDTALRASRLRERLSHHDAMHDRLTGLPNLTLLKDRLDAAIAQAGRHQWSVAVLFLDLDGFKSINDAHGHDVGDRLLEKSAARLQAFVRAGDTVCRRSGDEFLVVMLEVKDEASVSTFAHKLAEVISAPSRIGELELIVVPSIGVAIYPVDGRTSADLLLRADQAMYAAKKARGAAVLFSQMRAGGV